MASEVPPQLASLEKEVRDIFKLLSIGFQRLDKMKDVERQIKQLEELTAKMREAKRMIKEYDRDVKEDEGREPQMKKLLTEKKQSLIKELNSYVALRKTYTSSFGSKHELLDGGSFSGSVRDVDVRVASTVSNQEVMETGKKQMDEADQTTERTEKAMEDTINTDAETTVTTKEPIKQQSRMDKAAKLVKKISTDRYLMVFLLLIVVAVVVILAVKLVHPSSEVVQASRSTPPAPSRRLLHLKD